MDTSEILQAGESVGTPTQRQVKPSHRILVVDDDICILEMSVVVLTASGYQVATAEDGETGWEALQAKTYELLITDYNMPKLSGLELVAKLRSARMTLPVVLASGTLPREALNLNPSLRLAATLPKPFTRDELLRTVKAVLGNGVTNTKPADVDSHECFCCGERISEKGNGLSRDSTICASCSSLLDGREDRDQLALRERVKNIGPSKRQTDP